MLLAIANCMKKATAKKEVVAINVVLMAKVSKESYL